MASSQPDAVAGAPTTQVATAVERPHETNNVPPTPGDQQFEDALQQQQPETPAAASSNAPAPIVPPVEQNTQTTSTAIAEAPPLTRQQTEAIGSAIEETPTQTSSSAGTLSITLMLTTGQRHPYKIDEKYLRSRKMEPKDASGAFDPKGITGYQLKELIWIDWRGEWEPRPTNPSSIRLIILGRMIESKGFLRGKIWRCGQDQVDRERLTSMPCRLPVQGRQHKRGTHDRQTGGSYRRRGDGR